MKAHFGSGRYANVTSTIALVVALGGTSYAAIKLPRNSVTSQTVKDKSLLSKDFKTGQLPAGKRGAAGAQGAAGIAGAGAGSTAAIVCNTSATAGSYEGISLTAIDVSAIS